MRKIDLLILLHILVKKGIIDRKEAMDVLSLASLSKYMKNQGVVSSYDFDEVETYYSEVVKEVREYLSMNSSGLSHKEYANSIEKLIGKNAKKE